MVKHIRHWAKAIAAMALAAASNAMAIERGTCLPFDQMISAIEAEGQYDIMHIDDLAPNGEVGLTMYTTNDAMSRGYELSGTRPGDGQRPAQLCVDGVMRDIKIHNAWSRTVPVDFYLKNSLTLSQVETASATVSGGLAYGDHNTGLNSGAMSKMFPALQARLLRADGSDGALLTVSVFIDNQEGVATASRSDGLSMENIWFKNLVYTPEGARIIREQAASPKRPAVFSVEDVKARTSFTVPRGMEDVFGEPLRMHGERMTAAQWRNFANLVKNDKGYRAEMINDFYQQGFSENEALRRYEIMVRALEIKAKHANGAPAAGDGAAFFRN